MFDVGFSELVLIGLLALIVLGPQRLPEAARAAGRAVARLRRFLADVKRDFDRELHSEELAELRRLKDELDETRRWIAESSNGLLRELHAQVTQSSAEEPVRPQAPAPASEDNTPVFASPPPAAKPAARTTAKRKKSHGRNTRAGKNRRR